jgi:hypothetical protein
MIKLMRGFRVDIISKATSFPSWRCFSSTTQSEKQPAQKSEEAKRDPALIK